MLGKGGQTATSETHRSYAPWIAAGQERAHDWGLGQTQGFASFFPGFMAAGFTPDQTAGFDFLRSATNQYARPGGVPSLNDMMAGGRASAVKASPASATAAQLTPDAHEPFLNKYLDHTLDAATGRLNRQADESRAEIAARAAAAGTFGGSREALQKAQLDRSQGETLAELAANTYSRGFDTANQLASQNVDRQQQTALQNAAFQQQANMQNSQLGTQVGMQNARNALDSYGLQSSLQDADLMRQLSVIAALMGGGAQQQQLMQLSLDSPYIALQRYMSVVPDALDFTEKRKEKQSGGGGLGDILGGIVGIGKLAASSDENEKTDKKLLGHDPMTGLPIYSFRYRGDPKSFPKVVGPMAQDVEKKFPDKVREVAGSKTVDSDFLNMLLGNSMMGTKK